MKIEIKGMDELLQKLERLEQALTPALEKAMKPAIKLTQAQAKVLCPEDTGQLYNSISTEVEVEGDIVRGIVAANNDHAAYAEFGTGPEGARNHEGISPNVEIIYKSKAWWIPEGENGIDRKTAEKYGFFCKEFNGKRFYRTDGQPAKPFMYPAIQQTKKGVVKLLGDGLAKEIRRIVNNGES